MVFIPSADYLNKNAEEVTKLVQEHHGQPLEASEFKDLTAAEWSKVHRVIVMVQKNLKDESLVMECNEKSLESVQNKLKDSLTKKEFYYTGREMVNRVIEEGLIKDKQWIWKMPEH